MDTWMIWAIAAGAAAVLIPLALYFLPAQTKIIIDTPTSTARAEMRLLWGFGPAVIARAIPPKGHGTPLAVFNDAVRIGHALMTPGIADAAGVALRSIYEMSPRKAQLRLAFNIGDNAQNLVVQTGAQAALALAPAALRDRVSIIRIDAPGAELSGDFELVASPAKLSAIYKRFKNTRAAQEFRRRLKKKPKIDKRTGREVRVA